MSQLSLVTPDSISSSAAAIVRTLEGNAVKPDPASITNANFDPQGASIVLGSGWRSLLVFARFEQGTNPTITLEPLLLLAQANSNEPSSWVRLAKTAALEDGTAARVEVMGRRLYLRIEAITGSPTKVTLLVAGYEPFRYSGRTRD